MSAFYVVLHFHYYNLEVLLKSASITVQFMSSMKSQFHHSFLAASVLKAKESSVQHWKTPD